MKKFRNKGVTFHMLMLLSACIQLGIMSEITTMLATLLFQSEFRHQPVTLLIQYRRHC
jgi:hypothetical protein